MIIKYNIQIDDFTIQNNFKRIINQTYKLLPLREQNGDWVKPLQTLIEQLSGMKRLIVGQDELFFPLLCKMEGLLNLQDSKDMSLYRRIIFECLGLLSNLNKNVCN